MRLFSPAFAFVFLLRALACAEAVVPTAEQIEFFEQRIRPILAQECYECHSSTGKQKAGLVLDSRPGWQKGGDSGEAILPGNSLGSLLLKTIRHQEPDLKMPKNGAQLEEKVIQDFAKWVDMGAPDPRDLPAPKAEVDQDRAWPAVLERRKSWWSLQPVQPSAPPEVADGTWSRRPLDQFLRAEMDAQKLSPAPDAEPATILRRLSYVLTGMAPTPDETVRFLAAARENLDIAIAQTTDRLLASPRYGEQWARHWMDWVRYAESHGSEGDPLIPYAWQYRDYLIRALNANVPYPQLVREQIAGDLLETPRVNAELGINESAIGTAQYRFVLHGYSPTDTLDEQATFTDNQIDTLSKAFLGLTVSCARCHNHKFDAISQTDFYALYGVMASCRPATIDVNLPERQHAHEKELSILREKIRASLAEAWLKSLDEVVEKLRAWKPTDDKQKEAALMEGKGALAAWLQLRELHGEQWRAEWERLAGMARGAREQVQSLQSQPMLLGGGEQHATNWLRDGAGLRESTSGEFHVEREGSRILTDIYPAGFYTHLLSDKQRGVFSSPRFRAEGGRLWMHVRGDGKARARYVVQNYPRTGTVHLAVDLTGGQERWVSWDLDYWKGDQLYLELATESDQPVETNQVERSWFGISEAFISPDAKSAAPPLLGAPLSELSPGGEELPTDPAALLSLYRSTLKREVRRWADGASSDLGAEFLAQFIRFDLLPTRLEELPELAPLVAEYRRVEAELATPTRVPGVLEGFAFDQPLWTRGDHKQPAQPVPRRFLEALDGTPYLPGDHQSGRRALAESLVAPGNPLASRVMVNRLWQYVFGRGLVGTPDNFGRLGELPSHPALLDYLASEFQKSGGSIKATLRDFVTSRTFREEARASAEAQERDPENRLLSHFTPRRLDAESIRDSMVALTGQLEEIPAARGGGPSVDGSRLRRSVYTKVIRNDLDPLLTAFDFPVPFSTRGRREATNVPAQALALMNDPAVTAWAGEWAARMRKTNFATEPERVSAMFQEATGHPPAPGELAPCLAYLHDAEGDPATALAGLAQALFNAKEFFYLR